MGKKLECSEWPEWVSFLPKSVRFETSELWEYSDGYILQSSNGRYRYHFNKNGKLHRTGGLAIDTPKTRLGGVRIPLKNLILRDDLPFRWNGIGYRTLDHMLSENIPLYGIIFK